jgi:metal-responsive CopG/Arc/MetJ family transcriptional regulator
MMQHTTITFKKSLEFTIENLIKKGYASNFSSFIREAIQDYLNDIKKWEEIERCLGFQ